VARADRRRPRARRRPDGGFAALFIILLVLLLGSAAATFWLLQQPLDSEKERRTRDRVEAAFDGSLRFATDIGRLPSSLAELTARGALPATITATGGVRMGWSGPYLTVGFDPNSLAKDAWGRALQYGGSLLPGQIASAGPDGISGNADDLKYPSGATTATGNLEVNVAIWNKATKSYDLNPPHAADPTQATSATLYYASAGRETSVTIATSALLNPPYTFTNIPRGRRALRLTSSYKSAPAPMVAITVVEMQGGGVLDRVTVSLTGP